MSVSENTQSSIVFDQTIKLSENELGKVGNLGQPQSDNILKHPESIEELESRLLKQVDDEVKDAKLIVLQQEQASKHKANLFTKDLPQQYAAFENNEHAQQFMLKIDNYNELNLFEFKNQFRYDLQLLIEPFIKQAAIDRSHFLKFDRAVRKQQKEIEEMQKVLFKQDGKSLEEVSFFNEIFVRIRKLDQSRLKEEN